jgi:hypothetical protein
MLAYTFLVELVEGRRPAAPRIALGFLSENLQKLAREESIAAPRG